MTDASKHYIIGFRYPERLQPIPQYFIDDNGDWSIDDLPSRAKAFKDLEAARAHAREILEAKLGGELIKATRPALFKLHLLGYRVPVERAEPCLRIFMREDVQMDILEITEGGHELVAPLGLIESYRLEWTEWIYEDENKMVSVIEASGRLKEMVLVSLNLRRDQSEQLRADEMNVFGYIDGEYATLRVEFKAPDQLHDAILVEKLLLTEQVRHALEVQYLTQVSKIAADSRLKHAVNGRVYHMWSGWVQAIIHRTPE